MGLTSIDHRSKNQPTTFPDDAVTAAGAEELTPRAARRLAQAKNYHWVDALQRSDVNKLWAELHRTVCHHPLVRAS